MVAARSTVGPAACADLHPLRRCEEKRAGGHCANSTSCNVTCGRCAPAHETCRSQRPCALALFGGISRLGGPSTRLNLSRQFEGELLNLSVLTASYRWALPVQLLDVFIHSWAVNLADEFKRLWSPSAALFENNSAAADTIRRSLRPELQDCRWQSGTFCTYNSASASFSVAAVLRLVAAREDACRRRYSWVMLARPDLVFTRRLDPSVLEAPALPVTENLVWLGQSDGVRPHNRENVDDLFVFSSALARRMAGLFDYLSPDNESRPTGWGWWAYFMREHLATPGRPVRFNVTLRGHTIARSLCNPNEVDLRPLQLAAAAGNRSDEAGGLASVDRVQSWGFTCAYLQRFPSFSNSRSLCCMACRELCVGNGSSGVRGAGG